MDLQVAGCGCGSYWLGRCGVRRSLWLQVWYLICSYVGGNILYGVGQSDIIFLSFSLFSLFFGTYCSWQGRGFGLPPGLCYMCVCVGMACLFSVGERTEQAYCIQVLLTAPQWERDGTPVPPHSRQQADSSICLTNACCSMYSL